MKLTTPPSRPTKCGQGLETSAGASTAGGAGCCPGLGSLGKGWSRRLTQQAGQCGQEAAEAGVGEGVQAFLGLAPQPQLAPAWPA